MTKLEFQTTCESVWGAQWKRPAARALRRDDKMMRLYAAGDTKIPQEIADRLRQVANIGPAGEIIKSLLLGKYPPEFAHAIAATAVDQLQRAGLLADMTLV
jgi:hypothetical protein